MELKFDHKATKVQQLTDYIQGAIFEKELQVGDKLPSINYLSRKYCVSRDTVFKAFFKTQGDRAYRFHSGKKLFRLQTIYKYSPVTR